MQRIVPDKYKEEYDKLTVIWLDSETDADAIVREHGTDAFIQWWENENERIEKLRQRGIIEN